MRRLAIAMAAALAAGCAGDSAPGRAAPELAAEIPAPRLPRRGGPAWPTFAELGGASGAQLADVATCGGCHPDALAQWRGSAHASSSFDNPIYRAVVDEFRREVGAGASRFCSGCHDPALVADGAVASQVRPDDPRATAGVTCRVCHGIARATPDGNGSYALARHPIPIPVASDPASVARHRRAAAPIAAPALCGSCHRAFLGADTGNGHHLAGMDDVTPWRASAYAGGGLGRIDGPLARRDCAGCHMPRVPAPGGDAAATGGRIASHRFPGGHTWLAAMRGDPDQLRASRRLLRSAATVDVAAVTVRGRRHLLGEGSRVRGGDGIEVDVVVRNVGAGHHLPGGIRDVGALWLEVEISDRRGRVVAASGAPGRGRGAPEGAHVFRSLAVDGRGDVTRAHDVHRFRGVAADRTIPPRASAIARYRARLPDGVRPPVTVTARLLHRSRSGELAREACAAHRGRRGRAFARAASTRRPLDPCPPQPVTELARGALRLGPGASAGPIGALTPRWRRLYEHGAALAGAVQERVAAARGPLLAAWAAAPAGPDGARARATALLGLARVAGRRGRAGEAAAWAKRARAGTHHPAVAAAVGAAYARVWRWEEAVGPLRSAAERAPGNPAAWRELAVALGSLHRDRGALAAARRGLALSPRDPALLRVQAIALRALGRDRAGNAMEAYARHRRPDREPALRIACARRDPGCALERRPVHVHELEVR